MPWLAAAAAGVGLALACGPPTADERAAGGGLERQAPPGVWISGDAAALARVLDGLAGLRGSSLARGADELRRRDADCELIFARAPGDGSAESADGPAESAGGSAESADGADVASLFRAIECRTPATEPAAVAEFRGGASLAFALPIGPGSRAVGRARVDPTGGVDARLELQMGPLELAAGGFARFFVPHQDPPGPARLSPAGTLVHARLRPAGGLDLASLVGSGGQADQLFRLTSRFFAGAALDGTWELAVYEPQPGGGSASAMPGIALGLGMSVPIAARAGLEAFVADLETTWPVRHRPARFAYGPEGAVAEGGCFFDLRILPAFAPCWAAHESLLVVGWNPESIQRALAPAAGATGPAAAGGAVLALERWAAADAILAASRRALEAPHGDGGDSGDSGNEAREAKRLAYAWSRVVIEAEPVRGLAGSRVGLRLRLLAGDAS